VQQLLLSWLSNSQDSEVVSAQRIIG